MSTNSCHDVAVRLAEIHRELTEHSVDLDPEAKQILYDNLWDLYSDGTSPDACSEAGQPVGVVPKGEVRP